MSSGLRQYAHLLCVALPIWRMATKVNDMTAVLIIRFRKNAVLSIVAARLYARKIPPAVISTVRAWIGCCALIFCRACTRSAALTIKVIKVRHTMITPMTPCPISWTIDENKTRPMSARTAHICAMASTVIKGSQKVWVFCELVRV